MSFVPSVDTAQVNITADGAGVGATGALSLGDRFVGISFTFEYTGAGTPVIDIAVSNNASATSSTAILVADNLSISNVYSTENRFARYWVKVTGMAASDPAPLKVFVHRWP